MGAQISRQENSSCCSIIISQSFDNSHPRKVSGIPQKLMEYKKNLNSVPFLLIKLMLGSTRQSVTASTMHHFPSCVLLTTSKFPSHFLTQQNIITIAKEKLSKTSPPNVKITLLKTLVWCMTF